MRCQIAHSCMSSLPRFSRIASALAKLSLTGGFPQSYSKLWTMSLKAGFSLKVAMNDITPNLTLNSNNYLMAAKYTPNVHTNAEETLLFLRDPRIDDEVAQV